MATYRPQSRDEFEIAVICALPLETDAVEALLDKDYEDDGHSYGKVVGDINAYTIGRFGSQHVVVAHMPGPGTISAAAVASGLISSFHNIQVAFVVGVCGGIPVRDGQDDGNVKVFLGDVIISTSVIQVDFGRQYPDGFKRKKQVEDILGRAKPQIRSFVARLSGIRTQGKLEHKTHLVSSQMSTIKGFSGAAYPGPQQDITHPAEHRHKHWNTSCEICEQCNNNEDEVCTLALNSDCDSLGCRGVEASNSPDSRHPAVHFGRIACGNQVIKSGVHRDRLAKQEKIIGFEMESAGTWDFVPTIVVKGVCDYADSHKNKRWQRYAATTAAACTKSILEEWRNADRPAQVQPLQPAFPVHTTITRSISTLFTGRHDILHDLKSEIRAALDAGRQREPCHIVITGLGGQGKSELCLQLAHQLRSLFWGVFWVDVSTATLAENGFLDIAGRLGVRVSTWEGARQELANAQRPWLLVLDNADDSDTNYHPYFPSSASGIVLLTSRNAQCRHYATKRWIDLEGLTPDDAQKLLFQACNLPDAQQMAQQADAEKVVQLLRSHPLAIIQAGSYISRGHCSLKTYPQEYERQRKRLLEFHPLQAHSRDRSVYATFEASAESLQLSETRSASDALQLISLLAMFGPSRLPLLLFKAIWEEAQSTFPREAGSGDLYTRTTWIVTHLPALLDIAAETWDPFRIVEALNLLKSFSLISFDAEASSQHISMHPLVHAWARDRLSVEQQHACWIQAGCMIALSRSHASLWLHHMRQLQPHLQMLTSWPVSTMFHSGPTVEICRILVNCGWLLARVRDDKNLSVLVNLLHIHLKLDALAVNLQWLGVYKLTAQSMSNSGLIRDGVRLLKQVVKIEGQTRAVEHPIRLASQHALAVAYKQDGQAKEAIELLEQVVKIDEQTLAAEHPSRLASQYVLAAAYQANRQAKEAIELLKQMVKIQEQTLAAEHPDRLGSQYALAVAYRQDGQVKEAIELLEQVVKIEKQTLAAEHPIRLASQYALAVAYKQDGQVKEAIELLEQVVKIQEQTLAAEHPDRLASQHALAVAYKQDGQAKEAIELLEQVVKIEEQTLAAEHPDRLISLEAFAECLWQVGVKEKAVEIMREVINIRQRHLNKDHPDRVRSEQWADYFDTELSLSGTSLPDAV